MNLINLNSFLKFGYFLDYENPNISFDFSGIDKDLYRGLSEELLIKTGVNFWRKAIEKNFKPKEQHVVPLSGGLDSRAILAALLEFTEVKNIQTYTFGTPGTYDYDIGNLVAKKAGTNHTSFSFNDYVFNLEEEIDVSKRIDHQTFLFHHPPIKELNDLYEDHSIWSGYILDWFAGSHLPDNPKSSIGEAKKNILNKDTFVDSVDIVNISKKEIRSKFTCDFIDRNILSYEEQIEANHHLIKYTAPHILYKGFNFVLPSMDVELYSFLLSLPDNFRRDRLLFKNMMSKEYPKLFSLPTKDSLGLSPGAGRKRLIIERAINKAKKLMNNYIHPIFPNRSLNYLDFENGIRYRDDLNKLIYSSIMDLKNRKLVDWIDIDKIWKDHIDKKANHADALIVLASLEIHLKAGKKI